MTVLSACQSAAIRLIGEKPASLFSTTDTFAMELADLATETATAIAKETDWRALTKLNTLTGDGSTDAYDLPSDYDRMPNDVRLFSSQWSAPLAQSRTLDQWLNDQIQPFVGLTNRWIILGGQMLLNPALANATTAKFYYISNAIVLGDDGRKATFTADSDAFLLPERLLTLGVIWRWRSQKRLEYAEDVQNYNEALSQEMGRDKGSRTLTMGRPRVPFDVEYPFPGVITP